MGKTSAFSAYFFMGFDIMKKSNCLYAFSFAQWYENGKPFGFSCFKGSNPAFFSMAMALR